MQHEVLPHSATKVRRAGLAALSANTGSCSGCRVQGYRTFWIWNQIRFDVKHTLIASANVYTVICVK